MELLYYIEYTFYVNSSEEETPGQDDFALITDYMNEHIEDQITLDTITKKFAINRNKLNELFMKQSSMTCLNYLLNLRMDLEVKTRLRQDPSYQDGASRKRDKHARGVS